MRGDQVSVCVTAKVNDSSFFRKYTKLAMLALKTYTGDRKKNQQKKLPPVRIELRAIHNFSLMLYSLS